MSHKTFIFKAKKTHPRCEVHSSFAVCNFIALFLLVFGVAGPAWSQIQKFEKKDLAAASRIFNEELRLRRSYPRTAMTSKDSAKARAKKRKRRAEIVKGIEKTHVKLEEWLSVAEAPGRKDLPKGDWRVGFVAEIEGRRIYAISWIAPPTKDWLRVKERLTWKLQDESDEVLEERSMELWRHDYVKGRKLHAFSVDESEKSRTRKSTDATIVGFRAKSLPIEFGGRFGGRRGWRKRTRRDQFRPRRVMTEDQVNGWMESRLNFYRLGLSRGGWAGSSKSERMETTCFALMGLLRSGWSPLVHWKPLLPETDFKNRLRNFEYASNNPHVERTTKQLLADWRRIKPKTQSSLRIPLRDFVFQVLQEAWLVNQNEVLKAPLAKELKARAQRVQDWKKGRSKSEASSQELATMIITLKLGEMGGFSVAPDNLKWLTQQLEIRRDQDAGVFSPDHAIRALCEFSLGLADSPSIPLARTEAAEVIKLYAPAYPGDGKPRDVALEYWGTLFLRFSERDEDWDDWCIKLIEPMAAAIGKGPLPIPLNASEVGFMARSFLLLQQGYQLSGLWSPIKEPKAPKKGQ